MSQHPVLAAFYGTSELEKVAAAPVPAPASKWSPMKGGLPLAALVGGMLLARGFSRSVDNDIAEKKLDHNASRMLEANRNSQVNSTLRGGVPLDPMGSMLYNNERADNGIPLDTSMFDKAAAAHGDEAGRLLAKLGGIGGIGGVVGAVNQLPNLLMRGAQKVVKPVMKALPSPSLGTKALIGAGALGAGYAAMKGGKKALEFGMAPPQEKRLGGPAAPLPTYVNQYGVPELGH